MKLCSIASSSSGNCVYAGDDKTGILIDVGISKKRIVEGLEGIGVDIKSIRGILITHEHSDHVQGLGVMARSYHIPVYATYRTILAIKQIKSIGAIDDGLFNCIGPDNEFYIDSLAVHPFSMPHDAADPVCYSITDGKKKVSVATDMGFYNDYIIDNLRESSILMVEANHDINMVEVGPYTYALKQRILSDRGHLSNDNCGKLVCELMSDNLKHIVLGHLSKENNYPQLAYETVRCAILEQYGDIFNRVSLSVAGRDKPSEIIVA